MSGDIDEQGALARLGGKVDVYLRLLQSFQRDAPELPEQVDEHLSKGRRQEAMRALHTLKGVAGTAGATGLHAAAAQAEELVRGEEDPGKSDAPIGGLRESMRTTLAALGTAATRLEAAASLEAPAPAAVADPVALRAALDALGRLLSAANMRAVSAYARLKQEHGASLKGRLQPLDEAMARLDFKQAGKCCQTLIQGIEEQART